MGVNVTKHPRDAAEALRIPTSPENLRSTSPVAGLRGVVEAARKRQ